MVTKKINKKIRVDKQENSSLSAFVERPVPTEKEVDSFEKVVKQQARHQEIDSNLSEIYRDKRGDLIDVKKMKIKRRQLFIIRWFRNLLIIGILGLIAYFAYIYFFNQNSDITALELNIVAPEKVIAGEEFSYEISYTNPTKFTLTNIYVEVKYPESFIYNSSSVFPKTGNYGFALDDLPAGQTAKLSITGKLIAKADSVNIISTRLSYQPLNFSSQYKKESSVSTLVSGPGWRTDLEASNTAFLDQENDLALILSNLEYNYLGDFNLTFILPEGASAGIASSTGEVTDSKIKKIKLEKLSNNSWQLSGWGSELDNQEIPLYYQITEKKDQAEIILRLEKRLDSGESYIFWEKTIRPEIVNSDLNLTMFLNGAKNDNAISFSQSLNYTFNYSNRGENSFQDVVIMAVLKGEFLDWSSLQDPNKGEIHNNSIIWTKNEIPALAEIKPGQEGEINFTINLKSFQETDLGKNLSIISYAQYGINNQTIKGDDNKSNSITTLINSDLSLTEQIRYFNDDNNPVGYGPLPPRVDEKTGFRVYWIVKNNLHELSGARVVLPLPSYVSWDDKISTSVGDVYYDGNTHQIIWEIGRLPVSVYQATAEFAISITPGGTDQNKILILSPGATVTVTDIETRDIISQKTEAKTTKLEDDEIAGLNNSGRVE